MIEKQYLRIISHLESCLEKYGDTPQGVDWPRPEDVGSRHGVMLDVIRPGRVGKVSLLDFGCGLSHFYEYLQHNHVNYVEYAGLDISAKFIRLSRSKFPQNTYYCLDILDSNVTLPQFDYIVMNGVFTEKVDLSYEAMFVYFQAMIRRVFPLARIGIAFNAMRKQVDWERCDLFHLPLDDLAWFLKREISHHFVIRSDYGLYEYTAYVYHQPMPAIS